jgi:ABC-type sugar transport system permease subunit
MLLKKAVELAQYKQAALSSWYDTIGLRTYQDLLSDSTFQNTIKTTFIWVVLLILLGNTVGLLIAVSIFQFTSSRIIMFLSSYFVYPLAISLVAGGVIWRWLFTMQKVSMLTSQD